MKLFVFATVLAAAQFVYAADAINITITRSNNSRITVVAKQFQYEQSPRDLATGNDERQTPPRRSKRNVERQAHL